MRVHSRSRGAMDPGQGWPWRRVAMRDIDIGTRPPWTRVLACSLLALLASCALPSDPNSGVGVGLDDSGHVRVLYLPCAGDSIQGMTVDDAHGRRIWHAERTGEVGEPVNEIELGTVPVGWRGESSTSTFTGTVQLELRTIQRNPGRLTVDLGQLRKGSFLSGSGVMSRGQFLQTRNYCGLSS